MKLLKLLFLLLFLSSPVTLLAGIISFQLSWQAGEVTSAIQPSVTWSGITNPASRDWIGLYVAGAPEGQFIEWMYVSCSKSPGSARASGSCSFPIPANLAAGNYEFRLFANDGFTRLAVLSTVVLPLTDSTNAPDGFKVERKTGTAPFTEIAKTGLEPRYVDSIETGPGGFTVCWRVAAFNSAGDSDYTNEACEFINYVAPEALLVTSDPDPKVTGRVAWSNINNPSSTDWMGLYQPGLSDGAFLMWFYTDCSHVGTRVLESGSCLFTLSPNMPEGNYEFRFFANNGFVRIAISNLFTIQDPGPAITVEPAFVNSGQPFVVSWESLETPYRATDWIGVYRPGADATAFLDWFYIGSCTTAAQQHGTDGSCSIALNLPSGDYELRLYPNDGFQGLIDTASITVLAP